MQLNDVLSGIPDEDRDILIQRLSGHRFKYTDILLRKGFAFLSRNDNGGPLTRWILSQLKRIKGLRHGKLTSQVELMRVPWRLNTDVVLTHDLDWSTCLKALPMLLKWEESVGVRSVIFPLTRGPYRLDGSLIEEWRRRGAEIGLHGESHDPAFAFRPGTLIRDTLQRCMDTLQRVPVCFRSPALSTSSVLFAALEEIGIHNDSSIMVCSQNYTGCGFPSPYRLPGLDRLCEFPLALQDNILFRDHRLNDTEACTYALDLLARFLECGGLFVLNTHPSITCCHERFYRDFLDACREKALRVNTMAHIERESDSGHSVC